MWPFNTKNKDQRDEARKSPFSIVIDDAIITVENHRHPRVYMIGQDSGLLLMTKLKELIKYLNDKVK